MNARYGAAAGRVKAWLDRVSNLTLILLTVLIFVVNFDKVLGIFGTRGILGGLLFILLGFGIGHVLGGPSLDTRRVLAFGTAQRNIAASLLVAGQDFSDPRVVVMVIVVADVGMVILLPISRLLAKRSKSPGEMKTVATI